MASDSAKLGTTTEVSEPYVTYVKKESSKGDVSLVPHGECTRPNRRDLAAPQRSTLRTLAPP